MPKPTAQQCDQRSNTGSSQSVSPLKRYVKILHKAAVLKMIIDQGLIQNNQSVQKPSQATAKHGSTTSDLPLSTIRSTSHAPPLFAVDNPLTVHQLNHQPVLVAEQSGSVDRGDSLPFKEESGEEEVDIGPTKIQHMDSHYSSNQHITSAVKQESAIDNDDIDVTPAGGAQQESLRKTSLPSILYLTPVIPLPNTGVNWQQSAQAVSTPASAGDVCVASGGLPPDISIKVYHKNLTSEPAVLDPQDTPHKSAVGTNSPMIFDAVPPTPRNGGEEHECKDSPFGYRCVYCKTTCACEITLDKHIRIEHGVSFHRWSEYKTCEECLDIHKMLKEKYSDAPIIYKCGYCLKTCACKITLEKHLRNEHGVSFHRCFKCKTNFKSEAFLDRHIRLKHSEEQYVDLPHDSDYFKEDNSVKKYLKVDLNTVKRSFHRCSECQKIFLCEATLKRHMKIHFKKSAESLQRLFDDLPHVSGCFKRNYSVKKYLNADLNAVNGSFHRCSECQIIFISETTFKRHMKVHFKKSVQSLFDDAVPNTYICDYCQKTFSTKLSIVNHITNVHAIGSYTCDLCYKSFRCDEDLKAHKASAHIAPMKKCKVCGKLMRPCMVNKHMLSMHSGKKLQCKICGEFVKSSRGLHYHLNNVHGQNSPDSPFINRCSCCQKLFSTKKTLNSHSKKLHVKVFRQPPDSKTSFKSKNRLQRNTKSAHSKERHEDNYRPKEDLENNLHCTESSESTHPPVDEVNAGASTQQQEVIVIKEEPGVEELELGPVVFQHMDSNYRPYK